MGSAASSIVWMLTAALLVAALSACDSRDAAPAADDDPDRPDSGAPDADAPDADPDASDDAIDAPDADEPDADEPDADEPPEVPSALLDLDGIDEPEGFYDFPFPSDLRLRPEGAPDVSNIFRPDDAPLTDLLIDSIHRDNRGFSPLSGIYFRFNAPLDARGLSTDPAASLEAEAAFYVVNVDPGSPTRGERMPVSFHYQAQAGRFWRPSTLVLMPLMGRPLRPGTRYAAVVRRGLMTEGGLEPFEPPAALVAALSDAPPAEASALRENLAPLIDLMGIEAARAEVLTATVFTTSDPALDMLRLRDWMLENLAPPQVEGWHEAPEHAQEREGFKVYEGNYEGLEFFSGEPPYRRMGEGVIALDAEGAPASSRPMTFRVTMTVPIGDAPEGGWPLAIYGHGSGGDSRNFILPEGERAAEEGVAMISIDHPMHGVRGEVDFVTYLVNLALSNPAAGREMYRHAVPDFVQLASAVQAEGFGIPAEASHTGEPIGFDARALPFVGHSQGSQAGALLAGVEVRMGSFFLSAVGGGVATAFLLRKANGLDIERLVALAMGIDLAVEPLGAFHPLLGLLIQPLFDGADPLHYAHLALREPRGGARAAHLFMTEGLEDDKTIPVTIEALAAAFGLPIIEPVEQPSAIHDLLGIAPQALPLHQNVEVGSEPVTGGLFQFAGQGHSAFYRVPQASVWYQEWLRTSLTGAPTVSAP